MKYLIRLALLLVIGIVVYNYFFGTAEEKQQSKEVIDTAKNAGKAVWNFGKEAWGLLRSEKDKFEEGKYDEAVDKVGGLFDKLRGHAKTIEDNRDLIARLDELEQERRNLEDKINSPTPYGTSEKAQKEAIKREWEQLMRETEALMKEMEQR